MHPDHCLHQCLQTSERVKPDITNAASPEPPNAAGEVVYLLSKGVWQPPGVPL